MSLIMALAPRGANRNLPGTCVTGKSKCRAQATRWESWQARRKAGKAKGSESACLHLDGFTIPCRAGRVNYNTTSQPVKSSNNRCVVVRSDEDTNAHAGPRAPSTTPHLPLRPSASLGLCAPLIPRHEHRPLASVQALFYASLVLAYSRKHCYFSTYPSFTAI